METQKRNIRSYKVVDSEYTQAMKNAKKVKNTTLATLIESWIKEFNIESAKIVALKKSTNGKK